MGAFQYKGYDAAGKAITGEIQAGSVEEVERRMMNQQVTLVLVKPSKSKAGSGKASGSGSGSAKKGFQLGKPRRIPDSEGAAILSNLAVMVGAGVPFVEALDAIASISTREIVIKGIQDLKTQIVEGHSLATALRGADCLFPEMVADMVRVAEEGSSLSIALSTASSYLARGADLRRKVKNAMLYPLVMLTVAFLTVLVLVVFVMPKFAGVFMKMHADIPITTRLMLDLGDLIRGKPWMCLAGFIGFFVAIRYASKNEAISHAVGKIALRLPGIGDLLKKLALSRALQSISALISGNVPIVQALEHGAKVSGNRSLSDAIHRSIQAVQEGGTLSEAFAATKAFPPVLTQMIGVGERTGKLPSMISSCAEQMELETDARLKSLVAVLEPVMIVVMGLLVGTITVSIITPIYSAVQHIK
jgi:type II secretory pathway component PulF